MRPMEVNGDGERHVLIVGVPTMAKNTIEDLRALKPGWDSYGGVPITETALKMGQRFLDFFESIGSKPQIFPSPDGGVSFEWDDPKTGIEISPEGEISFFKLSNDEKEFYYSGTLQEEET
jgi:hypothetical protein